MPDEVMTSAPDSGASSGASTAAESAPVSTPAPSPTPAASTPTTTSEPAAVTPPGRNPEESEVDYIKRFREMREKAAQPTTPTQPESQRVDAKSEPTTETPKEEAKPAAEAPKEGEKPAEVKPEDQAQPNPLDSQGTLSVEKFAEALTKTPELAQALEKAGLQREVVEESLRNAAAGEQYTQLFGSVDDAKFAADQARSYVKMDLAAQKLAPGDINGTFEFIRDVLAPMDQVFNEKGEPVTNPDGSPRLHGAVDSFLDNVVDIALASAPTEGPMFRKVLDVAMSALTRDANALEQKGDTESAEDLRAVGAILQKHFKTGPMAPGKDALPPEVQQRIQQLEARERELSETTTKAETAKFETFRTEVKDASNKEIDARIDGILSKTSLTDFTKGHVKADIRNALVQKWMNDPLFEGQQESIVDRYGPGEAGRKALAAFYTRRLEADLKTVMTPILQKAGGEMVAKSQARAEKIATQTKQTGMEPRGGTTPSLPRAATTDPKQVFQEVQAALTKRDGKPPDTGELIAEYRKRMEALAAGAA